MKDNDSSFDHIEAFVAIGLLIVIFCYYVPILVCLVSRRKLRPIIN